MTDPNQTSACSPCAARSRSRATRRRRSSTATRELLTRDHRAQRPRRRADGELRVQRDRPTSTPSSPPSPPATSASTACRCCARRRSRCPASLPRVIRVLLHYYARQRPRAPARLPGRGAQRCAPIWTRHNRQPSVVRHLHRAPRAHPAYSAGRRQRRRRRARDGDRSRCSPPTSRRSRRCPRVVEAVQRAAGEVNRYPDPGARALRRALSDRYEYPGRQDRGRQRLVRDPAGGGRGAARALHRARLRMAVVLDVPAPRGRHRREGGSRSRSTDDYVHDLDAIAAAITDHTRLVIVCNPNNPTGTVPRVRRDRALPRAGAAATCS